MGTARAVDLLRHGKGVRRRKPTRGTRLAADLSAPPGNQTNNSLPWPANRSSPPPWYPPSPPSPLLLANGTNIPCREASKPCPGNCTEHGRCDFSTGLCLCI